MLLSDPPFMVMCDLGRSEVKVEACASKWKWMVAEIYRRTLDGIPFSVDNEAESPVLIKERQPIASRVLINSTLAQNRDLSLVHANLNEGGLDIEPSSVDTGIDAESALSKLHYGHSLRCGSKTPRSSIFEHQP
jgi:hypothetical protein